MVGDGKPNDIQLCCDVNSVESSLLYLHGWIQVFMKAGVQPSKKGTKKVLLYNFPSHLYSTVIPTMIVWIFLIHSIHITNIFQLLTARGVLKSLNYQGSLLIDGL